MEYSEELALQICVRLAQGESLVKVCKADGMPGLSTVYRWLTDNETFRKLYIQAREDQADTLADEILDIADEKSGADAPDAVNRARLRVDARKWIAAKLKPKKYGEKQHTELSGGLEHKHSLADALAELNRNSESGN